ncbi:hypothetical protein GCM10027089_18500 [Nocardia thraciensis]
MTRIPVSAGSHNDRRRGGEGDCGKGGCRQGCRGVRAEQRLGPQRLAQQQGEHSGVPDGQHADQAGPDALGQPRVAVREPGQGDGGGQQHLDAVQPGEMRDPQITARGAPVRDRHGVHAVADLRRGPHDRMPGHQRHRAPVGIADGLLAREPHQIAERHPRHGEGEPGVDGAGGRLVQQALPRKNQHDQQIREEQAGHAGGEDHLTDLVHPVGAVGVEVAEGAPRGLHDDEADIDEARHREDGAQPPGDPGTLVRQRQQPRQRPGVQHERQAELARLEPDRFAQQLPLVDDHGAQREQDQHAHRGGARQQRPVQAPEAGGGNSGGGHGPKLEAADRRTRPPVVLSTPDTQVSEG